MKTDYDYYLMGCRDREVTPLSLWRFTVAYGKYLRERKRADIARLDQRKATPKKRDRIVVRSVWLEAVAGLVRHGQDLADRARRYGGDDENGAAGAGMREPLPPREPVLAGCGARALPAPGLETPPAWWHF